jgi:glucose-1-phosphate cytidylyltransferase
MKVVILCGGQGTRLREETEYRPKPMVQIGDRPLLWHIMKTFARFGHRQFILCLGYKGEMIREYFLNYEAMQSDCTVTLGPNGSLAQHGSHDEEGWEITLANTGLLALTGARVKRVQKYVGNEPFFLTYGDGVANVNLDALLDFHRRSGNLGTVTGVRGPGRFGELTIDGDQVKSFVEKPAISGGFINGGFFVFEPEFFDYLSADDDCILERDPLERLAERGQLSVHKHDGFWQCVDTYRDFSLVNDLWAKGAAPWKTW